MNVTQEQADRILEVRDALIRLIENPDYKTVIEEAYFKEEAARLPEALTNPEMQDDVDQRLLKEQVVAIGHAKVFLNKIVSYAQVIEAGIKAAEKEAIRAAKEMAVDEITGEEYEVEAE